MAGITLAEVEDGLEKLLKGVEAVAPLAGLGGPAAGAIGAVVGNAAAAADTIVEAVASDAAIIGSGDATKIKALQQQLQAAQAGLTQQALDA